jgi:hypothetical protein
MPQEAIFAPMFAMFGLTALVWTYMYSRRIPFILSQKMTNAEMAAGEFLRRAPGGVSAPSDNLKNLFEMPVLFYALALVLFVTARVDSIYLGAAWAFAALRALHSLIHCTYNTVIHRFFVYAASSLVLFFMIARAGFDAVQH